MLFVGKAFGPADQRAADLLCRDTPPRRPGGRVSDGVRLSPVGRGAGGPRQSFLKEHLRALNGQLIGNNFLFNQLPEEPGE